MKYNIKRLGENSTTDVELEGCERLEVVKQLIKAIDNAQDFEATLGGPEEQDAEIIKMKENKPPLGLRPKCVLWYQRRIEILEAMMRYAKDLESKPIPLEWFQELIELEGNRNCEEDNMQPIPVTEKMPPQNATIILYCLDEDCLYPWNEEKGILVGWWSGTRFHGRFGKEFPEKVTHWFPIPSYPKSGG